MLNLSVADWETVNLPDRMYEDRNPSYDIWDRIDEEVKARNIQPHAWTKTVTVPKQIIPATTKTINL